MTDTPIFIPQPKKMTLGESVFTLPNYGVIGIQDASLYPAAQQASNFFRGTKISVSIPQKSDPLTLRLDSKIKPDGYRLKIKESGIVLSGHSPAAVQNGLRTLAQLLQQCPDRQLPELRIRDWPDFADRGVYYDVCRGRVPKLEQLFDLVDRLAAVKINHLQLYIEHTFVFRRHPKIGRNASPLSAEDILRLDAYCADRGVELVPSLACFGHLATVLCHSEYHHLAEDRGIGQYDDPEAKPNPHLRGWTLSPANPEIYPFLDSLFAEFLPLFHSSKFNICCDETWDLGLGQSYKLCQKKGRGKVYLKHILEVRKLVAAYGKKILFWGDIIRQYPELIEKIPEDVTVLDWAYSSQHDFKSIRDFKKAGLPFYACPGTSSWVSLFPRIHEATANIAGFAAAGKRNGAQGLLNTDWGDGGHYNFMELSWHGYWFGAEQAWNTKANQEDFTQRFIKLFLHTDDPALVTALTTLGDVTQLAIPGYYQSFWRHVFFAAPGAPALSHQEPVQGMISENGVIRNAEIRVDAALATETLARLETVRQVFAAHLRQKKEDPAGVLPYWIFAVDTLRHAAKKLSVLGDGGKDTPAARTALRREMKKLKDRFETLWMARNRRSEIRFTLKQYQNVINKL